MKGLVLEPTDKDVVIAYIASLEDRLDRLEVGTYKRIKDLEKVLKLCQDFLEYGPEFPQNLWADAEDLQREVQKALEDK
jgi:hypothetical protein